MIADSDSKKRREAAGSLGYFPQLSCPVIVDSLLAFP